jgi:hypothetical protein
MTSAEGRRGWGIVGLVVGLGSLALGVVVYAAFAFLVYHPVRSDAEACEAAARPGPARAQAPVAEPGVFPISSRCRWPGSEVEIELVSTRTTVIPLVLIGLGLASVAAGGVLASGGRARKWF